MKHSARLLIAPLLLILAGCAGFQAKFATAVSNFNTDVALIDASLNNVSRVLYQNCSAIQATARTLVSFTGQSSAAGQGVALANTAIDSYCQSARITDISSAVAATASAYAAVKSKQAKFRAGG